MRGMIGRLAAVAVGAIAASALALTTAGAQQFTMKLSSPTINDVVHEYVIVSVEENLDLMLFHQAEGLGCKSLGHRPR